jgi:hypothetical protein
MERSGGAIEVAARDLAGQNMHGGTGELQELATPAASLGLEDDPRPGTVPSARPRPHESLLVSPPRDNDLRRARLATRSRR